MQDDQKNTWADWYKIITITEKTLLVIIAFLTAYAVLVEIVVNLIERAVKWPTCCFCSFMQKC